MCTCAFHLACQAAAASSPLPFGLVGVNEQQALGNCLCLTPTLRVPAGGGGWGGPGMREGSRRHSTKTQSEAFCSDSWLVTPAMFSTLDHCVQGSTPHLTLFKWACLLFAKIENSIVVAEYPVCVPLPADAKVEKCTSNFQVLGQCREVGLCD